MDAKIDSKFNELDAKFDAKFGALSTKLSLGLSLVSLMFTAFVGLAGAMLVRTAPPAPAPVPVEQPAEAPVSPVGTASSPPAQEEPSSSSGCRHLAPLFRAACRMANHGPPPSTRNAPVPPLRLLARA